MLHYSDARPERGEFIGDGIARTAGNIPYNPESDDNASFPDDEFWNSRESLQQIKDYAVSRFVSPYAVLAVTLCRIIVATPPHVVLPPTIGADYGSLNFGVVILGNPGSGKDAAFGAAKALVPDIRDAPSDQRGQRAGHQRVIRPACAGRRQIQTGMQDSSRDDQVFPVSYTHLTLPTN